MTDASSSPGHAYAFHQAGKPLGIPSVVTQWDDKGKLKHQVPCLRVGQLAFNETTFFVLEANRVQGFIHLADIRGIYIEHRRSFRHPIIGAIVGTALLAAPISAVFFGDPFNIGGIFGGGLAFFSIPFVAFFGLYTLYEVLRNRQTPWVIIQTLSRTRPFILHHPLADPESQLILAFNAVANAARPVGGAGLPRAAPCKT